MLDRIRSLFLPLRIRLPFLVDLVILTQAEQIRAVEASGDVDRLHVSDTAELPWWARTFFRATRFHDSDSDSWFLAFEPTSHPDYKTRREYLEQQIATGYSAEDVSRIADLLQNNANDAALADAMVQIVLRRFMKQGEPVPQRVNQAAAQSLQSLGEAVVPGRYAKARSALHETMTYCQEHLEEDAHPIDAGNHNLGEIVQTTFGALRLLSENLETPVEELFTKNPQTLQVPRIAVRRSKLGGLLTFPVKPGWTVVILKIGKAAQETGDMRFVFGAGLPTRQCVFRDFFLDFIRDLQQQLRSRS